MRKEKKGTQKARSLGCAALVGGAVAWFRDAALPKFMAIPPQLPFGGSLNGFAWSKWTISWDMSLIMVAAGAIMGWKIAWSMLLGGIINYSFLAPHMVDLGAINPENLGYREIVRWSTCRCLNDGNFWSCRFRYAMGSDQALVWSRNCHF